MPTLKQAQQPPANLKNMAPISSPAAMSKPVPPPSNITDSNLNSLATGPIPAVLGTAYDSIKQWIRPSNAPQYRIFPLPLKANQQVGSIVNSVIESQPTTPVSTTGDLSWKGNWLSFQTYNIYDVVQFNISTYMALNTTTNVEPEGNPTNWVLVSKNLNIRGQWSGGAPMFVQGGISGGAFLANVPRTFAFSSNNALGNTIVVWANAINSGFSATPFTVSDTQGNNYTQVQNVFYPVSGPFNTSTLFVATGIKAGANTVSATFGFNSTQGSITIAEYGNIGVTPAFVGAGSFTDNASLPVPLTTNGTNAVLLFYQGGSSGSASPPGGFTLRAGSATNVGGGISVFWDDTITFAGTQNYTVSSPSATGSNEGAALAVSLSGFTGGYEPFDVVLFEGNTYICIGDTSQDPVTDPTHWQLLASGGITSIVNDTNVTATFASGVLTLGWTGLLGLSRGGTDSDLSATGGTSQVLRQSSVGASITVGQLAASDLSNGTTGTGAVVLAGSPTLTGAPLSTTPSPGDNSTKIATTAFVDTALASLSGTVAKLSQAMQSAAIAVNTIYAVPVSKAGLYRINWRAAVTQAASVSSSLGGTNGFQVTYTDKNDSVVKTSNPTTTIISAGNTTATTISGVVEANCAESTNLQYAFDYSSTGGTVMIYDLDVFVEYLGSAGSTRFAFDNFIRADANPIGAPWVKLGTAGGTNLEFQIASNIAEPGVAAASYAGGDYYSGITWPNDQYSEITIGTLVSGSGTDIGPVVRANGSDSWYGFDCVNGGTSNLRKFTGSQGLLVIASGTFTFSPGDVVRLTIIGTNMTVTQNGTIILTGSDASFASGSPGMEYYTPGSLTSSTITFWSGGSPT